MNNSKAESKRIQKKQGGHHLPPNAPAQPLDDTDRNTDKIIKPVHNKERLEEDDEQSEGQSSTDLQDHRAGANDPVDGKEELPEGLARPQIGPDHKERTTNARKK